MYLPAFSQMAEGLNTSIGYITMTMSSFFAGSCVGQLVNGPLLDKYGRKQPMILGLAVFFGASILCALTESAQVLIGLRFVQALAISVCTIGSKAVVRDIFPASQTARVFSFLGLIMGVAPIISPTFGSWLLLSFGWRSIFYFLAIFSGLLILALWRFLPNTLQKDENYSLSVGNILQRYKKVMFVPGYFGYALVTSLGSCVLFAWISSSSFVFIELLGLTEFQFGLVFASTASSMIFGNQVNIFLLKKFSSQRIALAAVIADLVVCGYLIYTVQYNFGVTPMIVGMCLLGFFLFLISTNTMAVALNQVDENLGVASAFMGSLRMGLSAVTTLILSYFLADSAMPMVMIIAVITLFSLAVQLRLKADKKLAHV